MTQALGMLPHFSATWPSGLMLRPYSLDQMLWLLFISSFNFCGFYLRTATI